MLEHLLDPQFDDLADASTTTVLEGQANTAAWLRSVGVNPPKKTDQEQAARIAFEAITDPSRSQAEQKKALLSLKVPEAVRHLAGMLSQYDWEFIDQAKQMRGYVAARLLEESTHPDARVRLRALQMLGNLTEVGSFTERIEITKKNSSDDEVFDRLRSKLTGLLPKTVEVQDAVVKNG